jgi:hypothetical protein
MITSLGLVTDPRQTLSELSKSIPCCVAFDFEHQQSYFTVQSTIVLTALCLLTTDAIEFVVLPQKSVSLSPDADPIIVYKEKVEQWGKTSVSLNTPWRLQTCRIPKPWGAEVWYTGIEERGVCTVNDTPLPWLIALCPEEIMGLNVFAEPLLLKILDPFADPDFGDLYFELHEQKTEVYIVTSIDESAWPDGTGYIRYGFNQSKVNGYPDIESFKSAYLTAVERYQTVRKEIDSLLDKDKTAVGMDLSASVPLELQKQWMASLHVSLIQKESTLKKEMYSFTELQPLRIGDVIRVKPFLPHSLQHGVRVIEFQTAHYERHILSFTQKVMTQNHWDTSAALKKAVVELPENELPSSSTFDILQNRDGCLVESIANFDEFKSWRISLASNARFTHEIDSYVLIIGVTGHAVANGMGVAPEDGYFVNASVKEITLTTGDEEAVLLLAMPVVHRVS